MSEASYPCSDLTSHILKCAYEVHRVLGPGLLESTYRICLQDELQATGLAVSAEVPIPVVYKCRPIAGSYRADLIVEESVLVEIKSIDRLSSIHEAQALTYLKHSGLLVGLLVNFNVVRLKHGIRRFVHTPHPS